VCDSECGKDSGKKFLWKRGVPERPATAVHTNGKNFHVSDERNWLTSMWQQAQYSAHVHSLERVTFLANLYWAFFYIQSTYFRFLKQICNRTRQGISSRSSKTFSITIAQTKTELIVQPCACDNFSYTAAMRVV